MSFEKGNKSFPSQTIGQIRFYEIADPAAGSNINWTIPDNLIICPVNIHFRLVTDATVSNRRTFIHYDSDGAGTRIVRFTSDYDHAASLTRDYNHSIQYALQTNYSTEVNLPMPYGFIPGGGVFHIGAFNLQAADQLSNGRLEFLQWVIN